MVEMYRKVGGSYGRKKGKKGSRENGSEYNKENSNKSNSKNKQRKEQREQRHAAKEDFRIGELDQYLFSMGTHYDIYKKLGAHEAVMNGKKGVYFADLGHRMAKLLSA